MPGLEQKDRGHNITTFRPKVSLPYIPPFAPSPKHCCQEDSKERSADGPASDLQWGEG